MATIRVLLVDDQEIIRQGIATILRYAEGFEVIGQAGDGEEAIREVTRLRPDVVLMDIKMPRMGGIPATRQICEQLPETRVVILTTFEEDDLVFAGIKAGAQGYLLKDASGDALVAALRRVAQGEVQLDPKVANKVLHEFQRLLEKQPSVRRREDGEKLVLEPLTPREEDVLKLLVEGLSNREIGARLYLTEGTIKNHVSTIIAKLQANDRTHAVVTALRRGLVDL